MSRDKRTAILRAAEALVKGRRFHEVTMEDVAKAAGVSKGTIYTYFRDKDELFFQLATEGFDELCELVHKCSDDSTPFRERLLTMCRQVSGFFLKRRHLMRVAHDHDGRAGGFHRKMRKRWMERRHRMIEAVAAVLQAGVEAGELREDVPTAGQAMLLLGMMRSWNHAPHQAERESRPIDPVVDLFLNGAGAK